MAKYTCNYNECNEMAIWMYAPSGYNKYYCDMHVPRGCFCNIDPTTGIEDMDEKNRLYPCCEYWWDNRGFDVV